jgi:hypothetical protein
MSDVMEAPALPPPGMTLNALGHYVPTHLIKPEHRLEDQLVCLLVERARALQASMAAFRSDAFSDVDALLETLTEKYEAKRSGAGGNTTLISFDGLRRVQVATGDFLTFGPELQIAKNLIDECLARWTEGGNDNIRAIVNDAFNVGKEGKIQVDAVLRLRRLAITDPTWVRAMTAIGDAIRTTHSKRYVRFYERKTHDGEWKQISLDLSRVSS